MRTWAGKCISHALTKAGSALTRYLFIHACVSKDVPYVLRGAEGILNSERKNTFVEPGRAVNISLSDKHQEG